MSGRQPSLTLSQQTFDKMIELAWAVYPQEAVGLLGGSRGVVTTVYGVKNIARFRKFFADPYSQYQAIKAMEIAGERLIATFHSHPEGSAEMSEADVEHVFEVSSIAIIIALRMDGHTAQVNAFSRVNGRIQGLRDIVLLS